MITIRVVVWGRGDGWWGEGHARARTHLQQETRIFQPHQIVHL